MKWIEAFELAELAHLDQKDKAGAPYILHPLRVAARVAAEGGGDDARCAAVLHDVLEDSSFGRDDLAARGVPGPVLGALDDLTRRAGESYEHFIERIAAGSPLARLVKIADLEDNLDPCRHPEATDKDRRRNKKYLRALARLKGA